jgi:beta-N-acetylhexosaminidase
VSLDSAPDDLEALVGRHPDRRLVLVLRDAARHDWQQATVRAARALRPDAILVETGLSNGTEGTGYVVSNGAGRANLDAVADALTAR